MTKDQRRSSTPVTPLAGWQNPRWLVATGVQALFSMSYHLLTSLADNGKWWIAG
ncbi:hypothetical protein ACQ859_26715 [Roseateles chitinivorans]|uniref:hypothetical protein n=1 Tax=Roseateles chitinivorans TaxID=2917965 RepID=UPI003D675610